MQRAILAQRTLAPARPWLAPIVFAALLVAYNNLLFGLPGDLAFPRTWVLYSRAVLLPLAAVVWVIRGERFRPAELGITIRNLRPSVATGLAAAVVVGVPAVLYLLFPIGVSEGSLDYHRASHHSLGAFLFWSLVRYPLSVAVFEEVLFRGVLLALALRTFGAAKGIVLSAAAFATWHIVVNYTTIGDSSVADNATFFALAQVGSLAALFVGGLVLAAIRQRTGSLAGPIAFHWLAVVAMNAALFAQS